MARRSQDIFSDFMKYLCGQKYGDQARLPSLPEISKELEISIPTLREQMEVARVLGFIEAKPRKGIKRLQYSFRPAVMQSLLYAISIAPERFEEFSSLRSHIETAYFAQAVDMLTTEDINTLYSLIRSARDKLNQYPIIIPHSEHRELHLAIYQRLDNVFVTGLLEAYWDAYERIGLDIYADIDYLSQVWNYHERIVDAIAKNSADQAYTYMVEHMALLYKRPQRSSQQRFE